MNPRLQSLQPYPFARMNALLDGVEPAADRPLIPLSIGEPKHAPPEFATAYLEDATQVAIDLGQYPATRGSAQLREAIATWLKTRFDVQVDSEVGVLPVNGTREALFSFAQAILSGSPQAQVLMPNPFYQIYEGAALLANAQPVYVPNQPSLDYQQNFADIDADTWAATELVYICSPGNPTGQVMPQAQMQQLVELALEHSFVLAADECYSEIYFDETAPPASLLNACIAAGNPTFKNCVIFHSLSKRSNLPGLRSGFVAGDSSLLASYFEYRTYHGCAMSAHHQQISTLAWGDEHHVASNRALYQQKFRTVEKILAGHLDVQTPQGGFYHWLTTPMDDTEFCRRLYAEQHVKVLPGQYLGRPVDGINPGQNHVRVAWVAQPEVCTEAAERLVEFCRGL